MHFLKLPTALGIFIIELIKTTLLFKNVFKFYYFECSPSVSAIFLNFGRNPIILRIIIRIVIISLNHRRDIKKYGERLF